MSGARAARLALPEVTLVCVDTRTPQLAVAAMRHCMAQIDFGAALLFTAPQHLASVPAGITAIALEIGSVAEYSRFMLTGLAPYLRSSHFLVVQWDGYVLDAGCWSPEFLDCDYIGAPLRGEPPERAVGNGGFSLRSRRLVEALSRLTITQPHPEDICICHRHREELERDHGVRFAPMALAQRFAYERTVPAGPTFGFHGLFNMHRLMPAAQLHALVASLPDGMARGLDAHDLCTALIAQGQLDTARLLLDKRLRLGMRDRRTWRLRWRWRWRWLRALASRQA